MNEIPGWTALARRAWNLLRPAPPMCGHCGGPAERGWNRADRVWVCADACPASLPKTPAEMFPSPPALKPGDVIPVRRFTPAPYVVLNEAMKKAYHEMLEQSRKEQARGHLLGDVVSGIVGGGALGTQWPT